MAMLLHCLEDGLLVADKPAGLLCQPGLGPDLSDSLLTRIQRQWPDARLVHRLDRDASGLLLLAVDAELHRVLSRLFAERQIVKTYRADVEGTPEPEAGSITLPILKHGNRPPRYASDPLGKPCRTDWRRLEIRDGWSRMELSPVTGRSHQLRVHLSSMGHPILGDPLYGNPGATPADRLRLHACRLAFTHPFSGQPLVFHSPCPF